MMNNKVQSFLYYYKILHNLQIFHISYKKFLIKYLNHEEFLFHFPRYQIHSRYFYLHFNIFNHLIQVKLPFKQHLFLRYVNKAFIKEALFIKLNTIIYQFLSFLL